jgi:hypothetical protein
VPNTSLVILAVIIVLVALAAVYYLGGNKVLNPQSNISSQNSTPIPYIYCIGGAVQFGNNTVINATKLTYYAPLSSSGIGNWTTSTPYPINSFESRCVSSNGYIYCIGGETGPPPICASGNGFVACQNRYTSTDSIYYAPISSSGIGNWVASRPYPTSIQDQSCVSFNGYVYCIGGDVPTGGGGGKYSSSTYYASLSSSGIGTWTASTPYPPNVYVPTCTAYNNYLYCVGSNTNQTYYAPISSSGIGTWTPSTAYPQNLYYSLIGCTSSKGYIYCVGIDGSTYYAPVSSSGIGAWTASTSYPLHAYSHSCISYNDYVYCVGGNTTQTYYAPLSSSGIGNWTASVSYPVPILYQNCAV